MNLKKCEKCRFANDEKCIAFTICQIIETAGELDDIRDALIGKDKPIVEWALKQA